ncbi:uncharacterized protein ACBT44_009979 isoform 1-T2 [Syngnathus typhle]
MNNVASFVLIWSHVTSAAFIEERSRRRAITPRLLPCREVAEPPNIGAFQRHRLRGRRWILLQRVQTRGPAGVPPGAIRLAAALGSHSSVAGFAAVAGLRARNAGPAAVAGLRPSNAGPADVGGLRASNAGPAAFTGPLPTCAGPAIIPSGAQLPPGPVGKRHQPHEDTHHQA